MNTFTMRRELRVLTTPVEVFEECLLDIRDGLWVCGVLSQPNETCTHVAKPMGCAIGMIGINTGNCSFELKRDKDHDFIVVETWHDEDMYCWSDLAQECGNILAQAAVEVSRFSLDNYIDNHGLFHMDDDETAWSVEEVQNHIAQNEDADVQDVIISYNDSGITKEAANKWFAKALEIANKKA